MGALFHDLYAVVDRKTHDVEGAKQARSILNKLGFDEKLIDKITYSAKQYIVQRNLFRHNRAEIVEFARRCASHYAFDLVATTKGVIYEVVYRQDPAKP